MCTPQPITAITGEAGEGHALRYLQARGLAVVSHNYHYKGDEIDLVMRDAAGTLVLVELHTRVTRSTQRPGGATASVAPAKQHHLIAAAEGFLARQVEDIPACRFDVIATDGARIE